MDLRLETENLGGSSHGVAGSRAEGREQAANKVLGEEVVATGPGWIPRGGGRIISLSPMEKPMQGKMWSESPMIGWTQSPFVTSSVASGSRTPPMWTANSPLLPTAIKRDRSPPHGAHEPLQSSTPCVIRGLPDGLSEGSKRAAGETADSPEALRSLAGVESIVMAEEEDKFCPVGTNPSRGIHLHNTACRRAAEVTWEQLPNLPLHIPGLQAGTTTGSDDDILNVQISFTPDPETASEVSLSQISDLTSISKRADSQQQQIPQAIKHSSITQMYLLGGPRESKEQTIQRLKAKLRAEALAAKHESILYEQKNRARRQLVLGWLHDSNNFEAASLAAFRAEHEEIGMPGSVEAENSHIPSDELPEIAPEDAIEEKQVGEGGLELFTCDLIFASGSLDNCVLHATHATEAANTAFPEKGQATDPMLAQSLQEPLLSALREDCVEEYTGDLRRESSSGSTTDDVVEHLVLDAPRCGCFPRLNVRRKASSYSGSSANSATSSSEMSAAKTTIATSSKPAENHAASLQPIHQPECRPSIEGDASQTLKFVSSGLTTPTSLQSSQMSPANPSGTKWLVGKLGGKKYTYPDMDGPLTPVSSVTASVTASFVFQESTTVSPRPLPDNMRTCKSPGLNTMCAETPRQESNAVSPSGRPTIWGRA
mmetsp:Transcript_39610/g.61809  ORF Transcript_39610/g.61809 Transcript_39610/m.61809 type:complete len:656 (-) Transcript_39610:950-2917(-)|eukprot:CAMPEP_0184325514 /NCGR_PEP_ID=MMETSP1049-20130417/140700_1 /TAXON_ID=77928 /ORGANISM="Proteomonas sulcata, Strain CCMP704" /LENGTH=655 /DNA_ID=CAMNT_0026647587 /DNA_START=381 /DNA_END=2348 /DNA_ORIENTATION=-